MKFFECSLCGMQLVDDKLIITRLARHTHFHKTATQQKRNTTNGIPTWSEIEL